MKTLEVTSALVGVVINCRGDTTTKRKLKHLYIFKCQG